MVIELQLDFLLFAFELNLKICCYSKESLHLCFDLRFCVSSIIDLF
jgi:hypothetical protein